MKIYSLVILLSISLVQCASKEKRNTKQKKSEPELVKGMNVIQSGDTLKRILIGPNDQVFKTIYELKDEIIYDNDGQLWWTESEQLHKDISKDQWIKVIVYSFDIPNARRTFYMAKLDTIPSKEHPPVLIEYDESVANKDSILIKSDNLNNGDLVYFGIEYYDKKGTLVFEETSRGIIIGPAKTE